MEEVSEVDEVHIYRDGDWPEGHEPLVFDLDDITLSAGETIDIVWDERGIIGVEP
jgi:hypothetical protein